MPTSIQYAPPVFKGLLNESGMVDALPDINTTVHGMAVLHLLSKQYSDFVSLPQCYVSRIHIHPAVVSVGLYLLTWVCILVP